MNVIDIIFLTIIVAIFGAMGCVLASLITLVGESRRQLYKEYHRCTDMTIEIVKRSQKRREEK